MRKIKIKINKPKKKPTVRVGRLADTDLLFHIQDKCLRHLDKEYLNIYYNKLRSNLAQYLKAEDRLSCIFQLYCKQLDLEVIHTPNEGKRSEYERYLFDIMGGRKGVSDYIGFEPRIHPITKKRYSGFCFELKVKTPYKKNGMLRKCETLKSQGEFIEIIRDKGFFAKFVVNEEAFIELNKFLKWEKTK